jgi:hypothetical protein
VTARWPQIVALCLGAAGFAATILAYYPGIFTYDTLDQFRQAQTGAFNDWHPPVMAALWYVLDKIMPGPALLFFFHAGLFWIGLTAFSLGAATRNKWIGAGLPLIGFAPFVFNFVGVLWKDVALMGAWTFAIGIVHWRRANGGKLGSGWAIAAWAALIYGALARVNSLFAVAPLVFYLLDWNFRAQPKWKSLAFALATPLVVLAGHAGLNAALHAERQHTMSALMIFDIVGVAAPQPSAILPGDWTEAERGQFAACYRPDKWDRLEEGRCASLQDRLGNAGIWGEPVLTHAWLHAIAADPIGYAAHRAGNFAALLRLSGPAGDDNFMESEIRDARYAHRPSGLYDAYKLVCADLAATPFFRPWPYVLLAAAVGLAALRARPSPNRAASLALATSSLLYIATYAIVGVAPDFRYAYWTIVAAFIAAFLTLPGKRKSVEQGPAA